MFTAPKKRSNNKFTILTNARIFDPESGFDELGELLIIDDKIADFTAGSLSCEAEHRIDCGGKLLTPGLLDIQVHFRDPGQPEKEDIISGSKSAVSGGITTVVCQPNTKPVIDCQMVLEYIQMKAEKSSYCNIKSYGTITKNMAGIELSEMMTMHELGAVGFTDDVLPVMNAGIMRRAMEYAAAMDSLIAQHAEDLNLSQGGSINEGAISSELGVIGVPNISESVIVERDIAIAKLTGCRYHVLHLSTKEALDAVRRGKARGVRVTAEVSPHHFTLTDKAVLEHGTNAKMNPPLRSEEDRLALLEGLSDGTIDAIATDHAPHNLALKEKPLGSAAFGIIGLETMLPLSLALYRNGTMNLRHLLAAMTYRPADIIKVDRGRIKKGAVADLTLIDLEHRWRLTPDQIHSRCHNTPFINQELIGRAIMTIVGGSVVYQL